MTARQNVLSNLQQITVRILTQQNLKTFMKALKLLFSVLSCETTKFVEHFKLLPCFHLHKTQSTYSIVIHLVNAMSVLPSKCQFPKFCADPKIHFWIL
jgi:hypothetical protein